jgi:DNA repair photolyase
MAVQLINKKGSTLHDFPYASPARKCFHCWIINVTPAGPMHCVHSCLYCYGRDAIYSDYSDHMKIYNNLPELVERDLNKIDLCPPISLSNITDPCQNVPELRQEVTRLVQLLVRYKVSFAITTKGDPSFLLDIPGFVEHEPKFLAMTIEGTSDILDILSPQAPSFEARLKAVSRFSQLGIGTVIRLDPVFPHLFQALYGDNWFDRIERLVEAFARNGAKHIVASTGRLSKIASRSGEPSIWQRVASVIEEYSPKAAQAFQKEYIYQRGGTSQGYLWRKDLCLEFHHKVRNLVEANGMTYATCQELSSAESDSNGIPHCEGLKLPFCAKGLDGYFHPIQGCTANCHISCSGLAIPPCGQVKLVKPQPFKLSDLKLAQFKTGQRLL